MSTFTDLNELINEAHGSLNSLKTAINAFSDVFPDEQTLEYIVAGILQQYGYEPESEPESSQKRIWEYEDSDEDNTATLDSDITIPPKKKRKKRQPSKGVTSEDIPLLLEDDPTDINDILTKMTSKMGTLVGMVNDNNGKVAGLSKQIGANSAKISNLAGQVASLQSDIAGLSMGAAKGEPSAAESAATPEELAGDKPKVGE